MTKLTKLLTMLMAVSFFSTASLAKDLSALNPEDILVIEVENPVKGGAPMIGRIAILMRPDIAPNHVKRIKELARQKFYDGVIFHRVIPGFMAQTGDPEGKGTGGSGKLIDQEFTNTPHMRGTVSMARAGAPRNATEEQQTKANNSADSQFFICYTRRADLDKKYTVWGRVKAGMDIVDSIPVGEPPRNPGKMKSVRVAADIPNWATLAKDFK